MHLKHFFAVFILISLHLNAQYETINWLLSGNTMLNFTTTPAVVSNTFPISGSAVHSSVSDAAGILKVVTSSGFIYNAQGQLVAPQNPTVPAAVGEQSGLVIPKPGNPNLYYIFFVGPMNSNGNLSYSVFDPSLAGGAGSLTVMNNTVNAYITNNGLCAIRHCNGKDVWVVCAQDTNVSLSSYKIYSYLLSASGINTVPVISSVSNLSDPSTHSIGYLRSSPDGRHLAIGSRKFNIPCTYSLAISDFNRTTGAVTNAYLARVFTDTQAGASYFEFSPDGSKVYTVERPRTLVQLDLCAGSPAAVVASANTVATLPSATTYSFYRGIQRAINGQIYLTQWASQSSDSLAAIQQPNNVGSACAFSLNMQSSGTTGGFYGYFPHYPHYLMKPLISVNQPHQACSKISVSAPFSVCATVSGSLSSYYWDFGEPASQTNTSTVYSPTHSYGSPGNYHIKLILNDGQCVADTLHQHVTVLPNSTLNISVSPLSQTVCPGQTTTLTASGASGYTWMPGNISGTQVSVSPQSSTTYTIKGADNIGCESSTLASISVYPVNNLTVSTTPTTVCAGKPVTLTVNGAYSYTWNTGSQSNSLAINSASNKVYTINAVGGYSCAVSAIYSLNVSNCTAIADISENAKLFFVYPNPATDVFDLELNSREEIIELEIFNSLGQIVYSNASLYSGREKPVVRIDVSGRPKGIYFVKVCTRKQSSVTKLVLE